MSDKVTIKCHWCGGEFEMPKSDLDGTMNTGIQMCFEHQFAVFSGRKQITGEVIIKVTPLECDICEACAMALASGSIKEIMIERNINPETMRMKK